MWIMKLLTTPGFQNSWNHGLLMNKVLLLPIIILFLSSRNLILWSTLQDIWLIKNQFAWTSIREDLATNRFSYESTRMNLKTFKW